MAKAVQVDTVTQRVIAIDARANVKRLIDEPESNRRWLAEGRDWAATAQMPAVGDLWEGNHPGATFIAAPPATVIEDEADPKVLARKQKRFEERLAALEAKE